MPSTRVPRGLERIDSTSALARATVSRLRVVVEQLARLGHNDATAVPIDELDAKLLFKSLYLST
jgi:hypothetical protein